MSGHDETQQDEEQREARRKKIIERLNDYDPGVTEDDRRKERDARRKKDAEKQDAIETSRRGIGMPGGISSG